MFLSVVAFTTAVVPQISIDYRLAYEEIRLLERLDRVPLYVQTQYAITVLLGGDVEDQIRVDVGSLGSSDAVRELEVGSGTFTRLLRQAYPSDDKISFSTATLAQIRAALGIFLYLPVPFGNSVDTLKECAASGKAFSDVHIVARASTGEPVDLEVPGDRARRYDVLVDGKRCTRLRAKPMNYRELLDATNAESDVLRAMKSLGFSPEPPRTALAVSNVSPWLLVENRTVASAKDELLRRLSVQDRSAVVFGLPIFPELIVVAVPVLILVVQLLLWIHISGATAHVSRYEASVFAWVGLYRGIAKELVADFSIFVVPTLSGAILWWAADITLWKSELFVLLSGTLGLCAVRELIKLRLRVASLMKTPSR